MAVSAPHCLDEVVIVKRVFHLVEVVASDDVGVQEIVRLLEHILLDIVEQCGDFRSQIVEFECKFVVSITACNHCLTVFDVARTDFETYGDALHFPFVEFPTGGLFSVVEFHSHARIAECGCNFVCLVYDALFMSSDGHYYDLDRCDYRREFETALVAVCHNECTDKTS